MYDNLISEEKNDIDLTMKVVDPSSGEELGPQETGELCFKGPQVNIVMMMMMTKACRQIPTMTKKTTMVGICQ